MTDPGSPAVALRALAGNAYDEGHGIAAAQGKNVILCHENGLVTVLLRVLRAAPSEERERQADLQTIMMETLPFNIIDFARGRAAIIEYVVWREHEGEADIALLRAALREAAKVIAEMGPPGRLEALKTSAFRWAKLLD